MISLHSGKPDLELQSWTLKLITGIKNLKNRDKENNTLKLGLQEKSLSSNLFPNMDLAYVNSGMSCDQNSVCVDKK